MIEEPNLFTKRVTSLTFGKFPEKIGLNGKRLLPLRGWDKIGRASCRERVCQYV